MAIEIIPTPPLRLTSEEANHLGKEYQKAISMMVDPPPFETWARHRIELERQSRNRK